MNSYDKCIILDFDCTIGYFRQIIYLLNIIEKYYKLDTMNDHQYFKVFDCYPNMFRPKIYDLFNLILSSKDKIQFFVLYTNNQNIKFVSLILQYIKMKLKYNESLFDYTFFNTTKEKSLSFIKKSLNITNDKILFCYIDDSKNINMSNRLLHYVHCEKYIHNYDINEIIHNFPFNSFDKITKSNLQKYFSKYFEKIKIQKQLPRSSFHSPSTKLLYVINLFIFS